MISSAITAERAGSNRSRRTRITSSSGPTLPVAQDRLRTRRPRRRPRGPGQHHSALGRDAERPRLEEPDPRGAAGALAEGDGEFDLHGAPFRPLRHPSIPRTTPFTGGSSWTRMGAKVSARGPRSAMPGTRRSDCGSYVEASGASTPSSSLAEPAETRYSVSTTGSYAGGPCSRPRIVSGWPGEGPAPRRTADSTAVARRIAPDDPAVHDRLPEPERGLAVPSSGRAVPAA